MQLNDLFVARKIDPSDVLVLRHTPKEKNLRRALPFLAVNSPDLFNAYQSTQSSRKAEAAINNAKFVASFIGIENCNAIFAGLYKKQSQRFLTKAEFWRVPEYRELKEEYDLRGFPEDRPKIVWFELKRQRFYENWIGKLIVNWPGGPLPYYRWGHKNRMDIVSIAIEDQFSDEMPRWDQLIISWRRLKNLQPSWRAALKEWRGVYFVFDTKRGKGYVGSAYGSDNILGRWKTWRDSGHGGNKYLRDSDPENLHFSILELDAQNCAIPEVIQKENWWKTRLHTRWPLGLNGN